MQSLESFGEWIKELFTTYIEYIKFWVVVNHYQEAVILRFGRYYKTLSPGYYFKWPLIDYSLEINVKPETINISPVSITTLDGKSVEIGLMIDYTINNSKLFLVEANDAWSNILDIARGEISDYLEDVNWIDIKKKVTKNALRKLIQERYSTLGIFINDLNFTDKCETRMIKLFGEIKK